MNKWDYIQNISVIILTGFIYFVTKSGWSFLILLLMRTDSD